MHEKIISEKNRFYLHRQKRFLTFAAEIRPVTIKETGKDKGKETYL